MGTSSPHPFNLNGQPCYIYFHLTYEFLNDVEMIWYHYYYYYYYYYHNTATTLSGQHGCVGTGSNWS